MGGSTVIQSLWTGYEQAAQTSMQQVLGTLLPVMASVVLGAIGLAVIVFGSNMMMGSMDAATAARRVATAIVVAALTTTAMFNQWVTDTLTQTVPHMIAQGVGMGATNNSIPQAYDAILNQVTNMAEHVRAQAIGLLYIGDRIACWLIEIVSKLFVVVAFLIYALAALSMYAMAPVIAVLSWTFLFDRTRAWGERAVGHAIGLLLVQLMVLMVTSFVVHTESQFMTQFGQTVAAAQANQSFSMNAGDLQFTGSEFQMTLPADGGGPAPGSINIDGSIGALINCAMALAFGLFLLSGVTIVAFSIAASSGMSATPVVNMMTMAVTRSGGAAARVVGRAR